MSEKYFILKQCNVILLILAGTWALVNSNETLTTTLTPIDPALSTLECNILPKRWILTNNTNETNKSITNGVVFKDNVENGCIISNNYPEPYTPSSGESYIIEIEEGYRVDISITELDLDSGAGDYLSIKSGYAGEEVIFMWFYDKAKHFTTAKNIAVIKFVVQERADPNELITHKGFYLQWKKTGELITTTEIPTTVPSIPDNLIETLTVYITGNSTAEEFVNTKLTLFIKLLANVANKYCEEQNIPIENNITTKNVNISSVAYCSSSWPNYQDCIKIIFAIPVFLEDTPENSDRYELTESHLQDMWDKHQDTILGSIGMEKFNVPDFSGHVKIWVGISLLIAGLFAIFLYFLWRYEFFYVPNPIRRLSETHTEYGDKPRMSDISLYPTEHQVVPPMFDSLCDPLDGEEPINEFSNRNSYPLYEPDDVLFSIGSTNRSQNHFGSFPRGYPA